MLTGCMILGLCLQPCMLTWFLGQTTKRTWPIAEPRPACVQRVGTALSAVASTQTHGGEQPYQRSVSAKHFDNLPLADARP